VPAVIAVDRLGVPAVKEAAMVKKAVDLESNEQYTKMENVQYYGSMLISNTGVPVAFVLLASVAVAQTDAIIKFLDQYKVLIAVSFAIWYIWNNYQWKQWAKKVRKSVNQIEITSQVVATRANMTDFRMCSAPGKSDVS